MVDNVNVTPGTGTSIAADDIGGVMHQRVKLVIGADGVSNGDVAATNPMPSKIIGADGTPIGNVENKMWVTSFPYTYALAEGLLAGHFPVHLIGYVNGVNATRVDIWEAGTPSEYVFPVSPIQMRIVSSSTNDTGAGTGVRTVDIGYLDTNYNQQSETVTLNGTNPVNTVATNILRINSLHTMTAGSGACAAGNISLQNTAGTVTYSRITATHNFSRQLIYTVPAGYKFFITSYTKATTTAASGHSQEMGIRTTSTLDYELTPGIFQYKSIVLLDNSSFSKSFDMPIMIPPMTDIKGYAISDGANAAICTMTLEGWIDLI